MANECVEKEIIINRDGYYCEKKSQINWPLSFRTLAKCSKSKARTSLLQLPHFEVETPIFMPVGTQGTMKGLTTKQLEDLNCQIILGNTYHLGMRPVRFFIVMCTPHATPAAMFRSF